MSKYTMDDGTIVDTDKAKAHWNEDTWWDGHNHISVPTGSQWDHQTLYRSRKGRFYIECTSQWQGSKSHAEWMSDHAAASWLLANGEELPADIAHLEEELTE